MPIVVLLAVVAFWIYYNSKFVSLDIERLHASFCHAILVHSFNRFSLCTKMTAVVVAKLLLCCDIICKRSIT